MLVAKNSVFLFAKNCGLLIADYTLPRDNALKAYNAVIKPTLSQIRNLKRQNVLLREARDILLPLLMNGGIDATSVIPAKALVATPNEAHSP